MSLISLQPTLTGNTNALSLLLSFLFCTLTLLFVQFETMGVNVAINLYPGLFSLLLEFEKCLTETIIYL